MGGLTIRSNIASLRAQRQLAQSSGRVSETYERLASGSRINRASDDAAGLAIASSLRADARVYSQAIRNGNDGISAMNIAEGALSSLSSILTRLNELAIGASNGTLALRQRQSLDQEAFSLRNEYNRIISATDFNGTRLLDGTLDSLGIQLGYGTSERISFALGEGLERSVGSASGTGSSYSLVLSSNGHSASGDFNADGIDDIVADVDVGVQVYLGRSDGSLGSTTAFGGGPSVVDVTTADVNGDGFDDIIANHTGTVRVYVSNGNGTFQSAVSYASSGERVTAADFDGDGRPDIAVSNQTNGLINILKNNGNGTFGASTQVASSAGSYFLLATDMNNDGRLDLVNTNDNGISTFLGNGDGTFTLSATQSGNFWTLASGDFNHDGVMDLVSEDHSSTLTLLYGRGDGGFGSTTAIAAPFGLLNVVKTGDFNGDGEIDIAAGRSGASATKIFLYLNNGDGTFSRKDLASGSSISADLETGDFNGDGVLDFISPSGAGLRYFRITPTQVTTLQRIDLTSRSGALAALSTIDGAFQDVIDELGRIGGTQSRLKSAINNLHQIRLNYEAAHGRIADADIASESARLVSGQIAQQMGASVLAQANQLPLLVLELLSA